jgi:hypothetical protein
MIISVAKLLCCFFEEIRELCIVRSPRSSLPRRFDASVLEFCYIRNGLMVCTAQ